MARKARPARRKTKPTRRKAKPAKKAEARTTAPASRPVRSLAELLATDEPAWPMVQGWIGAATKPVEVLPVPKRNTRGEAALVALQVSVSAPLGAVIYETGGLLVDHGWLRILGSGHRRMGRSVPDWTASCRKVQPGLRPTFLLVADDVLGGFFALDGGASGPGEGEVLYFGPGSLRWEPLGMGYSDFLRQSLMGDLRPFYRGLRWPGWEDEVSRLQGMRGLSVDPPLWTVGPRMARRLRTPSCIHELWRQRTEIEGDLRDMYPEPLDDLPTAGRSRPV